MSSLRWALARAAKLPARMLVLSTGVALALAACGQGDEPDSAPDGAGDPESAAASSPGASPPAVSPPAASPAAASAPDGASRSFAHAPDVDPEIALRVADLAMPVSGSLMQSLSGNLMAAIDRDGAVGAVEFCNLEAMPLRQAVEEEMGFAIKRTSWRVRNPDNAPDALEQQALDHFASVAAAGEVPQPWVQSNPDGGYRFYRPLPTAALCLNCHGGPDQLAEGIPEVLAELYPDDRAVGFAEGELRGLLRVSVPAAALDGGEGAGR